jgi:hypothetical protein
MPERPTATERIDTTNVRLSLHCLRCQTPFGEQVDARRVRLGGMEIRQRVVGYCLVCRRRWKWRPGKAAEDGQG